MFKRWINFFLNVQLSTFFSYLAVSCLMLCTTIFTTLIVVYAQTPAPSDTVTQREAALQAELNQVLKDIDQQQQILSQEQQKGVSLERDIAILNAQIQQAKLKIQARNLAIQALGKDINAKNSTIQVLTGRISVHKDSLAHLIRKSNEFDSFSLADVVFSNQNISDFFVDVDAFGSVKQSIENTLGVIQQTKTATEIAKETLSKKQLQEIDAKISIISEQKKIQSSEAKKAQLLSLSQEQQANYKGVIAQKVNRANAIRAALFSLRDSAAIPFGKALDYATFASKATGIKPAFLLAILTQESNLGANVGSCFLTDKITGAGMRVKSGAAVAGVMKPERDIPAFLRITSAVSRDPLQTRVSCPFGGGYGGAMGPSQFIPSTWELFQSRIGQAVGKATPDPWDPRDAFMASALYLADLGASDGSYSSERDAACRYYSGRSCDSRRPANSFYGDNVMAKAETIQTTMIDQLQ